MHINDLAAKIERVEAIIGVIGLGYVGLPVAATFARSGFQVIGIDIDGDRVAKINDGQSPIEGDEPGLGTLIASVVARGNLTASTVYSDLAKADVVLIDVQTPVDTDHIPRYEALRQACEDLGVVLKPGSLVIVESTIAPGTIDRVVRPILERQSDGKVGVDFFLGACPERVMPGKLLLNLRTMSRVCGGTTPETAAVMVALYRHIVEAELDAADAVTAEVVKTTENAYRDVQIAFANEVALICEAVGADVWQVRELVNKSPFRNMHLPGAGVGGHCIPKDPWLLAYGADGRAPVRLIPQARAVNDSMPGHVAELTLDALRSTGVKPGEARVVVLGYAYLENSDDARNSPSELLVQNLREQGMEVRIHDPWIADHQGDLLTIAAECDAAIIMVAHQQYRQLNWQDLMSVLRTPAIIDGRHVVDKESAEAAGFIYRGVGQG